MYAQPQQQWNARKRGRDDEVEESGTAGFSEHRSKRRIANLPTRSSPFLTHSTSPRFGLNYGQNFGTNTGFNSNTVIDSNTNYTTQPAPLPPTITPADSDSEGTPAATQPKSFFSPYSSSPQSRTPTSPRLDPLYSSQSTQISDVSIYSDDQEMEDTIHLSPGPFQHDPSMTITGRIPTPIHSQFSIRPEKPLRHQDSNLADDDTMIDSFIRGRRLPSPISEGEASPAGIVAGFGEMQMDVERETPTKKGHQRSKHSLRNWTGLGELNGHSTGMKRSFTMGYRSDCEKCRNKVPGHFSHIITF